MREGHNDCANYLDDFCVVGRNKEPCMKAQRALLAILGRIGFFRKLKKTVAGCYGYQIPGCRDRFGKNGAAITS